MKSCNNINQDESSNWLEQKLEGSEFRIKQIRHILKRHFDSTKSRISSIKCPMMLSAKINVDWSEKLNKKITKWKQVFKELQSLNFND